MEDDEYPCSRDLYFFQVPAYTHWKIIMETDICAWFLNRISFLLGFICSGFILVSQGFLIKHPPLKLHNFAGKHRRP